MASKKYLTIEKDALDKFTLVASRDSKGGDSLSPEERLVGERLFTRSDRVLLRSCKSRRHQGSC